MKGMRLALCMLPILSGHAVIAEPMSSASVQLQIGQSIQAADATLLASGWLPQPDQAPQFFEQVFSQSTLPSLSSCSGTGVGFCRYNYFRDAQRLSVVTIPAPSPSAAGLVQRWWVD